MCTVVSTFPRFHRLCVFSPSFPLFCLYCQTQTQLGPECLHAESLRLGVTLDRWTRREGETESTIFIFVMLQYSNTSERSRDTAAIVRLCCRDFQGSHEISCKPAASLVAQMISLKWKMSGLFLQHNT